MESHHTGQTIIIKVLNSLTESQHRGRRERERASVAEAVWQRPWLFSEMNINNISGNNGGPEIREITSIVPPSPTDTDRSAEGRRRRIEERNLAAHHAPSFLK